MSDVSPRRFSGAPAGGALASHADMLRQNFDRGFAKPRHAAAVAVEDFLALRLEAEPHALSLSEITGLFLDKKTIPIPGQTGALRGIAGFRGIVVPVYDLAALMGYKPAATPRWLVRTAQAAFAFDGLDGHLRVPAAEIVPQSGEAHPHHHVRAFLTAPDYARPIVHVASLLDAIARQATQPGLAAAGQAP